MFLDALFGRSDKSQMVTADQALPGRSARPFTVPDAHAVTGNALEGPFPEQLRSAMFGMGCFWGAERKFWSLPGVWSTAVGYAAGHTTHPTYREVCSGQTGHNEVVLVIYDPELISYADLLKVFWESHDPTQGMRQGNDAGTQYRSGVYTFGAEQAAEAEASKRAFGTALQSSGFGPITTEVLPAPTLYYAEDYHQQYLHKNPGGYCGLGGTGVSCPVGVGLPEE